MEQHTSMSVQYADSRAHQPVGRVGKQVCMSRCALKCVELLPGLLRAGNQCLHVSTAHE